MQEILEQIVAKARTEFAALSGRAEFESAKARYVGPNGELTGLMKQMGASAPFGSETPLRQKNRPCRGDRGLRRDASIHRCVPVSETFIRLPERACVVVPTCRTLASSQRVSDRLTGEEPVWSGRTLAPGVGRGRRTTA